MRIRFTSTYSIYKHRSCWTLDTISDYDIVAEAEPDAERKVISANNYINKKSSDLSASGENVNYN